MLHRFIPEDPLGFAGSGANLYAYVFNDPTNLNDPLGLSPGGVGEPVLEPPGVAPEPPEIPLPVPEPPSPLGPPGTLPFCAVNPEVCVGAVGVIGAGATGAIIYYGGSATAAALNANAADAELAQTEHNLNQIYLGQSLAGRYSKTTPGILPPTSEHCKDLIDECSNECLDEGSFANGARKCIRACLKEKDEACYNNY